MTSEFFEKLKQLIGPFPESAPLSPEVLGTEDCGSYWRKKISFASEPNDRIPAYLLLPKQLKGRTAAIYCHHQHAGNWKLGKSEVVGIEGAPDQALGRELVERGYVVLCPDAIAFEERNWSDFTSACNYFELTSRLVQGRTLMAKALHDISVGIDYLQSLDEVEPTQIGFIGFSYGGRMALWAAAFDKRIRASVSACGANRYETGVNRSVGLQMELCIPGIMKLGDMEDIVALGHSTSILILAATEDKWSQGADIVYERARTFFPAEDLKLRIFEGPHSFPQFVRKEAYEFLDNRLRSNKI